MKRAILLLVVVVGGAFYLGWFTFTTDNTGNTEHVNIVINKDKLEQDEGRALQKLHSLEQQAEQQAASPSRTSAAALPGADRSADRRMRTAPQPIAPYEGQQPSDAASQNGYPQQPRTGFSPAEPAPAVADPYELPQRPRSASRSAAETANESFSRGFQ
jgi:hypothetical protein